METWEIALYVLGAIVMAVVFVGIADSQKDHRDWYTDVLANPTDHIGEGRQGGGYLVQQMDQYAFVFQTSLDGKQYYVELVEGAQYQNARQGDTVTIRGYLIGLKYLQDGQGRTIALPHLQVDYIQVQQKKAEACPQPQRLLLPHGALAA